MDPRGKTLSSDSNVDVDGAPTTVLQLNHAQPEAGRWHIVVIENADPGKAISSSIHGRVQFDDAEASAPALPNDAKRKLAVSHGAVAIPLTVKNTSAQAKAFFTDARTGAPTEMELPQALCAQTTTLPGFCAATILAPHTSAAAFVAKSTAPITMDAFWFAGGPDVYGKAIAPNTVAAQITSREIPWNLWESIPSTKGPYGAEGAPTQDITTTAYALMPRFDDAVTSDTGNYWADQITGSTSFQPLVLGPGESGKLRPRIVPTGESSATAACEPWADDATPSRTRGRYRPWAELLKRTFALDVLACPECGGRLRLVALVPEAASITRYLRAVGEPVEPAARAPPRGPPYWASRALRRRAGDVDAA